VNLLAVGAWRAHCSFLSRRLARVFVFPDFELSEFEVFGFRAPGVRGFRTSSSRSSRFSDFDFPEFEVFGLSGFSQFETIRMKEWPGRQEIPELTQYFKETIIVLCEFANYQGVTGTLLVPVSVVGCLLVFGLRGFSDFEATRMKRWPGRQEIPELTQYFKETIIVLWIC